MKRTNYYFPTAKRRRKSSQEKPDQISADCKNRNRKKKPTKNGM